MKKIETFSGLCVVREIVETSDERLATAICVAKSNETDGTPLSLLDAAAAAATRSAEWRVALRLDETQGFTLDALKACEGQTVSVVGISFPIETLTGGKYKEVYTSDGEKTWTALKYARFGNESLLTSELIANQTEIIVGRLLRQIEDGKLTFVKPNKDVNESPSEKPKSANPFENV